MSPTRWRCPSGSNVWPAPTSKIVVPVLRRAAESVQLYHGHRDGPVEIEGRHVLRRGRGDDPTFVADRKKDVQLHRELLSPARGQPPDTGSSSMRRDNAASMASN